MMTSSYIDVLHVHLVAPINATLNVLIHTIIVPP